MRRTDDLRLDLVWAARTIAQRRVRFHHRGRDWTGVDCSGLLVLAAKIVGIPYVDIDIAYEKGFSGDDFIEAFRRSLREVIPPDGDPCGSLQNADVLLFDVGGRVDHAGLVDADGNRLIHADACARRVVEHDLGPEWRDRARHIFSIPLPPVEVK